MLPIFYAFSDFLKTIFPEMSKYPQCERVKLNEQRDRLSPVHVEIVSRQIVFRMILPIHASWVCLLTPEIFSLNTLWLRDDLSLHFVSATALLCEAFRNNPCTCGQLQHKVRYTAYTTLTPVLYFHSNHSRCQKTNFEWS